MVKWVGVSIIAILIIAGIFVIGTKPKTNSTMNASAQPENSATAKQWSTPPEMSIDPNKKYVARIETSKGSLNVELFAKEAPKTVNNFIFLARNNFYDDVVFHRIIKGFMLQTGDPQGTGMGGPGYTFADEPVTREYKRGVVAMANAGPNTNGSQFFIMHADYPLPKNYTIFGSIAADDMESFKTVDAIAETPVTMANGENSKPTEKIVITGITVEEE